MRARLLSLFILGCLCLSAAAQGSETQMLVLHHAGGDVSKVELYTMPRIQMTADKLVITSAVGSQEYPKSDVVRFTFEGVGTGISSVRPETRYRVDEDRLTFYGISSADRISVYNAGGTRIPVRLTADGHDAVLSIAQLPQGVYLVNLNGRTFKFIRP